MAARDPFRQAICSFHAAGGRVRRDGLRVLLDTTTSSAPAQTAGETETFPVAHREALERLVVPRVTEEQTARVRAILTQAGATVAYVTDPKEAAFEALALRDEYHADLAEHGRAVIGLDMETEVKPELREPVPVRFTKTGNLAKRQPKDGVAGLALDPYSSRVRLVQMWIKDAVRVFDLRFVPWSTFELLFRDAEIAWAAFNAVFEAKRLIHETGHMPAGRLYDVRNAVWMTDGRTGDLEETAKLVFGLDVPKVLGASDWSLNPLSQEQIEYSALDAVLAAALWHHQRACFEDDHPEAEVAQRVTDNAIEAVARAELHGVGFDRAAHVRLVETWEAELATAKQARTASVPDIDWSKQQPVQEHLTAALSGDGADALDRWPRTKTGLLVTARAALVQAKHLAGITEHLEVLRLEKLLNTFGADLAAKVHPVTGKLHTSLIIAGARTGRLASRGPNLQQMPKRRSKAFRLVFVASPGRLLLRADYQQIELRAAAELIHAAVGYSRLRDGFQAGLDAHRTTAMHLAGKNNPDAVTAEEREAAKPANFGVLYGMRPRGFFFYTRDQYQPDITPDEASDLYDAMHDAYPELGEWHDYQERRCRWDGFVETPLGRRWCWQWRAREEDEIDWDLGFVEDQRSGFHRNFAFNMPVQGGCAEVMLLAMARLDRALRPYPARLCLSVHDEVLIELIDAPDVIEAVSTIVVEAMTAAFLHVFPDAPTIGLVEPTVGRSWGEQIPVDAWLNKGGE